MTLFFLIVLSFASVNAKEALDLNGEWNATFICSFSGTYKQILKINQKDSQFVGIRLEGDERLWPGADELRGKVIGSNITEMELNSKLGWHDGDVKVSEGGNKIVVDSDFGKYTKGTLKAILVRK